MAAEIASLKVCCSLAHLSCFRNAVSEDKWYRRQENDNVSQQRDRPANAELLNNRVGCCSWTEIDSLADDCHKLQQSFAIPAKTAHLR